MLFSSPFFHDSWELSVCEKHGNQIQTHEFGGKTNKIKACEWTIRTTFFFQEVKTLLSHFIVTLRVSGVVTMKKSPKSK